MPRHASRNLRRGSTVGSPYLDRSDPLPPAYAPIWGLGTELRNSPPAPIARKSVLSPHQLSPPGLPTTRAIARAIRPARRAQSVDRCAARNQWAMSKILREPPRTVSPQGRVVAFSRREGPAHALDLLRGIVPPSVRARPGPICAGGQFNPLYQRTLRPVAAVAAAMCLSHCGMMLQSVPKRARESPRKERLQRVIVPPGDSSEGGGRRCRGGRSSLLRQSYVSEPFRIRDRQAP